MANKPGFHTELTPQLHQEILQAAREVIVPSQTAARVRIPKGTFNGWLKRGMNEAELGENTIFAQLSVEYFQVLTETVKESLDKLKTCPRNYQALTWILERCFRRDFGSDSEIIEKILKNFEIIKSVYEGEKQNG